VEGSLVYYNNKYLGLFLKCIFRCIMLLLISLKDRGLFPTLMKCPTSVPGLGWDNSIFIDSDGKWYLLVKNGQVNNWIVQLGMDVTIRYYLQLYMA